jgi:N-acetylmuramoyl-L-alanine amidase
MIVIIDNGHGEDTAGKRSPDGRLREYAYAREIAKRLQCALCHELGAGHVFLLTPETNDISLKERCQRANNLCKAHGASNALLVSIHNNAAGADGKWHEACGWSAHVSLNASQKSKTLATCLAQAAEKNGLRVRKYTPQQPFITQNLAICRDTSCPAVLTENLFQDNKEDVDFLLSEEGKQLITKVHVDGILSYIKSVKK